MTLYLISIFRYKNPHSLLEYLNNFVFNYGSMWTHTHTQESFIIKIFWIKDHYFKRDKQIIAKFHFSLGWKKQHSSKTIYYQTGKDWGSEGDGVAEELQ